MDFRRNQEDMVGFNPQIRASAFSKPLLPPTASLLSSPRGVSAAGGGVGVPARNNGVGSTATSDVFDPAPAVEHRHPLRSNPDSDLAPAAAVSDGLLNAVAAATPTTLTGSSTSATTKDSSPQGEPAAKYRECLRNHAASLGGHVLDGCGDFMPGGAAASGGGGDPLKCAACGCHRSFHRKEVEGEHSYFGRYGNGASPHQQVAGRGRLPLLLPPPPLHHHPPPQQWLARSPSGAAAAAFGGNYSGSGGATTESSSEEHPGGPPQAAPAPGAVSRKRFRSKFTTEQKKRMLGFAESVGWRMQKQDEAAVEQFCAEVGVRRQVLKVWMHNNKHTMRKQQQQYHDHPQQDQQQQPLQIQEHHQQQQHRPQLQLQPQPQQHTQPQQQQQHRPQLQPQQQQHTQLQQQHTQPQQQQQQQQHRPQPQQQHPHHPQQQHPHHQPQ